MLPQQTRPNVEPRLPPRASRIFYYDAAEDPFDGEDLHDENEVDLDVRTRKGPKQRTLLESNTGFGKPLLDSSTSPLDDWHSMVGRDEPREELQNEDARRQAATAGSASLARGGPLGALRTDSQAELAGVLEKRSPWWVSGWQSRHFLFRERKLVYFHPERADRPLGIIDFGLLNFELHCCWLGDEDISKRCCDDCCDPGAAAASVVFYLRPELFPSKIFAFRGAPELMRQLSERIAGCMTEVPKAPLEKLVLNLQNFWRYPLLREEDFLQQCQNGDLLLFKGTDKAARMQRFATRATYDHVALVLRTVDDDVLLLEATGGHGVNTVPWSLFKGWRWHEAYEWIAYRKVYFPRSQTQLTNLQEFIGSALGRPYGLNVGKLLNRGDSKRFDADGFESGASAQEGPQDENENRTFFCSELAAACLKRAGVLKSAKSAECYWPGSFSEQSWEPLALHDGVRIGEEQVLVYN